MEGFEDIVERGVKVGEVEPVVREDTEGTTVG